MRGLYLGGGQSGEEVEPRLLSSPCVEFPVLNAVPAAFTKPDQSEPEAVERERYYRSEPVKIGGESVVFFVHNDFFDEGTAGVVFRALCACLQKPATPTRRRSRGRER